MIERATLARPRGGGVQRDALRRPPPVATTRRAAARGLLGVDRRSRRLAEAMGEDVRVVVVAANGLERRGPVDAPDGRLLPPARLRARARRAASPGRRRWRAARPRPPTRAGGAAIAAIGREPGGRRALPQRLRLEPHARLRHPGRVRRDDPGEPGGARAGGHRAAGAEYEETVAALEEDLLALRDPRTGERGDRAVARMRAEDGGPPAACPDVVATFTRHEPPLLEVEHPRATIRQPEPWWDGAQRALGPGDGRRRGPRPVPVPGRGAVDPVADGRRRPLRRLA